MRLVCCVIGVCMIGNMASPDSLPSAVTPFRDEFTNLEKTRWHVANYVFSHPFFDTDWSRKNVSTGSGLELNLTPQNDAENRYIGGSIRSVTPSHFGLYSVRLKAAKGAGTVTGFFTYTGPYYGTQHDEIDIEILGKDTRKLHIATFVDGEMFNKFIDLDFDAAYEAHDYAFGWWPDKIIWYVDGREVARITEDSGQIPQTPSRLYANIWAADPKIASWAGKTPPYHTATTQIDFISYRNFRISQSGS